jgi:hypothetical protein
MQFETPTHARALRVIGQHLHDLGNNSFEICKQGNDYAVLVHSIESAPIHLHFPTLQIFESDIRRQMRRERQIGMPDMRSLSSNLRALGGFLDRKAADDFSISWSIYSVNVTYDGREETFSVHQNLYDLGVFLYLNRSYNASESDSGLSTH